FISDLKSNAPPLSTIESVECHHNLVPADYSDFVILESANEGEQFVPISADVGTCDDCLKELFDPQDRRYQYPFINCTNCGPRFTIIEDIPYDRAQTTMRDFEMCSECRTEYEDPMNRRFHAEPTACPTCGPQVSLAGFRSAPPAVAGGLSTRNPPAITTPAGLTGWGPRSAGSTDNAISSARRLLLDGAILAIKGIGGFHLACDGLSPEAVKRLRESKYREDKPFALMADSLEIIREHCFVSKAERDLLLSERRPIVLLERRPGSKIPQAVAPGVNTLGFMLPYTPLHHLLLKNLDRPLVMTSGNVSNEPICYDDGEATKRLRKIADYFLLHDRRIHMRTDDSVVRVREGREMVVRRSRGYAPAPIKTAFKFERQVLACGAELKSTFCLTRDQYAFVSHHIGDLENLETLRSFAEGIAHFKRLFRSG
ncbi:MAG: Sua5/YciO/YrdC/YwlC family protein, partial [Acidobacteria bacterium]|nr:Sua5/YciO/YrdC/YwlC family protein [Acidobacteriota bacterium]